MCFTSRCAGWPCDLGIRSRCDGWNASLEAAVRHPAGVCPEVGVGYPAGSHLMVALLLVSHLPAAEDAPGCVLCSLLWQHGAKRGRNWEESQAARAPLSCLDSVSDGGVQVEDSCEGSAFPLTANLSVTLIWNLQTTFLNDLSSQYAIPVKYLYGI